MDNGTDGELRSFLELLKEGNMVTRIFIIVENKNEIFGVVVVIFDSVHERRDN